MKKPHKLFCRFAASLIFSALIVFFSVRHVEAAEPDTSGNTDTNERPSFAIDGFISLQSVNREVEFSNGNKKLKDQDYFGQTRFDLTMPETKRFEFHFFGTLRTDKDRESEKGYRAFKDIGDATMSDSSGYLFEAHFDFNYLLPILKQLRLGRQVGTRDEPVFFDGLGADFDLSRSVKLTIYAGSAVHFDEHQPGSDFLQGFGIDFIPLKTSKLGLDYLEMVDERRLAADTSDQCVSLKMWQQFSSFYRAMVKIRTLNGEKRNIKLLSVNEFPGQELKLNATYFRQFIVQNELSNELAVFYDIMGTSYPYHRFDVQIWKSLGSFFGLGLGHLQRKLIEEIDENETYRVYTFNLEYTRNYLVFEIDDLPVKGLSITLNSEYWATGAKEVNTGGFDIGYRTGKTIQSARINAGTFFSLHKYDYYDKVEKSDVQTWYLEGQFPLFRDWRLKGKYEFENYTLHGYDEFTEQDRENYQTDTETYQKLTIGAWYDF